MIEVICTTGFKKIVVVVTIRIIIIVYELLRFAEEKAAGSKAIETHNLTILTGTGSK